MTKESKTGSVVLPNIHAVDQDEDEEEYPRISEICFSVDNSELMLALENLGEKTRILIDGGSFVNIVQLNVLKKMSIPESGIIPRSSIQDHGSFRLLSSFKMEKSPQERILEPLGPSWWIKGITSTLVHPQANGQAESSNKIIINNLKKKLGSQKGKWAEELSYVLWADRTTPKNATGQTPFSLVFGTEAMILTEMVVPIARTSIRDPQANSENLLQDLDTVDELRDLAKIRMASYQQRMVGAYNKNVRIRRFQVGNLVLRKTFQNTTNPIDGKLAPKLEGRYLIEAGAGKEAYRLLTMDGDLLPRAWNAIHLKKYFM
ncbi:uncharacterized protein LOC110906549 [Helianthus annuus]|uniref:uncharacterized protein LOC110906549 n=1 Tax=Helianthus annuus TaxID=4232 RepID=UPI000B908281|nr:uncharacterized protein LOC110906549 [Helianthus annuus]